MTSRESFENLSHWLKECDIYSTHDQAVKLLISNKSDLESQRQVTQEEGRSFARDNEVRIIYRSLFVFSCFAIAGEPLLDLSHCGNRTRYRSAPFETLHLERVTDHVCM